MGTVLDTALVGSKPTDRTNSMNILLISNSPSFHQLSSIIEKTKEVDAVFHYGANVRNKTEGKYFPFFISLPYASSVESQVSTILSDIQYQKIDLILTSGVPLVLSKKLREFVDSKNIPHLFPTSNLVALEGDRMLTKKMLETLNIPHSKARRMRGWELFRDFFKIPLPFVVKLEKTYKHGRQTAIITTDNQEEYFHKFFSTFTLQQTNPYNIDSESIVMIEDYLELTHEISYHALMNSSSWSYIGSARDYKKKFDGDTGELVDSLGSYFIKSVDQRIHEYADKIYKYLKSIGKPYKGFLFLGIGIATDGVPYVLEINARPGDPEIATIAASTDNFLEVLLEASTDSKIPKSQIRNTDTVSVSVNNTDSNWQAIASDLPRFTNMPDDIIFGIAGVKDFRTKHSLFTASGVDLKSAANKIYSYLETQYLGQFYYRKDIGLLE